MASPHSVTEAQKKRKKNIFILTLFHFLHCPSLFFQLQTKSTTKSQSNHKYFNIYYRGANMAVSMKLISHICQLLVVLDCSNCTSDHRTSILCIILLSCPSTTKHIHVLSPCASVTPFKIVRPKLLIASAISRK